MNESTSIYNSVELIPLAEGEISPLISKVKIKVFHLGANRNGSYIDKETALEMAKTLRGNPIVGAYKEEKADFTDHGQKVTIEGGKVKIECLTKPYGFVDLNADAWFENYIDIDEFGNKIEHTYLVTEGIVWRGQFPELESTLFGELEEGRPQSMELDEKTLKGNWTTDYNNGVDIFIISEALISKLCILGEDTEPCFLGSSVTPVESDFSFSLSKDFTKEMYSMMKELKDLLKGEPKMDNENTVVSEIAEEKITNFENSQDNIVEETITEIDNNVESISEENVVEESLETAEPVAEFTEAEEVTEEAQVIEETPVAEAVVEEAVVAEEPVAEFAKTEEEDDKESKKDSSEKEEDKEDDKEKKPQCQNKCQDDEDKKKYSLLEEEYNALKSQYADLESKYNELVSFKNSVEDNKKDEMINSFSMLDAEEKKDIIENKSMYTLEEIESKLSVMFTRKQMAASAEETVEVETPMVYSVHEDLSTLPDWVKAVKETEKNL